MSDPPAEAGLPADPSSSADELAQRRLSVPRVTLQVLGLILITAAVLWSLYRLQGLLLLLVLAIFFAYLLAPLVALLRRPVAVRGRSRSLPLPAAIAVVYVLIFSALALSVWLLLPAVSTEFSQLASEGPAYAAKAQAWLQSWRLYERTHLSKGMEDVVNGAIDRSIKTAGESIQKAILPSIAAALGYLPWLVLVPILALFLLKDAELFRQLALRVLPKGRLRWRGHDFFQDVHKTLAAYVRAQLIACLFIGLTCTIGFLLIGIPYAVVLGIGAGLLEFIPLAGPLTIGVLAAFFAAFHSTGQALATVVFLTALRILEDYLIYPRIMGHGIHLHPLAVILAILCGAELAGLPGIFLSIPAVALLSVAFRHWRELRADDAKDTG